MKKNCTPSVSPYYPHFKLKYKNFKNLQFFVLLLKIYEWKVAYIFPTFFIYWKCIFIFFICRGCLKSGLVRISDTWVIYSFWTHCSPKHQKTRCLTARPFSKTFYYTKLSSLALKFKFWSPGQSKILSVFQRFPDFERPDFRHPLYLF